MNQRIQELAEQATDRYDRLGFEIPLATPDLERFAQLIIQDCLKEIEDQVAGGREMDNGDHSPDWDAALECVDAMIRNRFGLKRDNEAFDWREVINPERWETTDHPEPDLSQAYVPSEPVDFHMGQRRTPPRRFQRIAPEPEPGMVRMIDPPMGRQYGFPKEIPPGVEDVNQWLLDNGYPRRIIEDFGGRVPCRFWTQEADQA